MPFVSQSATVTTFVPQEGGGQPPSGNVPAHPIYIPIEPPPDSGLSPEHPIYLPVYPDNTLPPSGGGTPPESGLSPSHPIYIPVVPTHPIAPGGEAPTHPIYIPVPPEVIWGGGDMPVIDNTLPQPPTQEQIQKIKDFLFGNLPENVQPV
jgi:hypothetical protein